MNLEKSYCHVGDCKGRERENEKVWKRVLKANVSLAISLWMPDMILHCCVLNLFFNFCKCMGICSGIQLFENS